MSASTESEESDGDVSSSYSSDGQIPLDSVTYYGLDDVLVIDPSSVVSKSDSGGSDSYSTDGEIICSSSEVYESVFNGDPDGTGLEETMFRNWFLPDLSENQKKPTTISADDTNGESSIHPMDVQHNLPKAIQDKIRCLTQAKGTILYVKSPVMTFSMSQRELPVPDTVICDVFVFPPSHPVKILTFATKTTSLTRKYNSLLAQWLTEVVREKLTCNFHLEHGVIQQEETEDILVEGQQLGRTNIQLIQRQEFYWQLQKIREFAEDTAMPCSLEMTERKQISAFNIFLETLIESQHVSTIYKDIFFQFVETAAYKAARHQLKQRYVLILTGGPGEGKTTIGHRLCYDYHQQGYNTVFYSRQQDINWDVLKATKPTLVVCDNVTDLRHVFCFRIHKYSCIKLNMNHQEVSFSDVKKQDVAKLKQDYSKLMQMSGISESAQNEIISELPHYVGFPKAVKQYRKYKHSVDPVTYFTYPLNYFIDEMENIAETSDMKEWVFLLLCGGYCKVDDDDDDDELFGSMRQLFPKNTKSWDIGHSLRKYIGGYLHAGNNEIYFSHLAIYDACLFVVDRKYPGFLSNVCTVIFERGDEQSRIRLPKLTVFISKHNTDMFLTQIVEDLNQGKFRHSLSHGVLRTQENIERLFTQIGSKIKDIIGALEDSKGFLYWTLKSDNPKLINKVLKQEIIQTYINRTLIDCIKFDDFRLFLSLRRLLEDKASQHIHCNDSDMNSLLMLAVQRNSLMLVRELVEDDVNLLKKNSEGNTALHLACLKGNTEVVKCLITKNNSSKNLIGQDSRTPVMLTALKGHGPLFEYLAGVENCTLTGVDDNGDTILHLACIGGDLDIVKHVISSELFNKNKTGQYGKTPLMIAAYCNHRQVFTYLLEKKCHISPFDFSIKDLISSGCVTLSTSLYAFLQSREHTARGSGNTHKIKLTKHLESKGSNMLFENESGISLLHTAANSGSCDLAELLLSKGHIDLNIRDDRGRTPVMLAAAGGHGNLFDFLLDKGCDLSLKDESSSGILHFACQGSNRSVIDKVMEHGFTDVNCRNDVMKTPFSYVVETGDNQIFETVLNTVKGGDLSVVDRDRNTFLHLACRGGTLAIVEYLLSLKSFDINAKNREHRTPLLVAAYNGYTDVCHHLICVGADLHIQDWDGNDVLLVAATEGNAQLTKYILKEDKENDSIMAKSRQTAATCAAEKGHREVFDSLICHLLSENTINASMLNAACIGGDTDIVQYILSHGSDTINQRDSLGRTPVVTAAESGHSGVFDLLVKKGSDLLVVDVNGLNILHVACIGGNVNIVQHILSLNIIDINSKDSGGRTPLMRAAENGHREVLELLESKGCDLLVVDKFGRNILHVAASGGSLDIVQHILSQNIVAINSRDMQRRTPVMSAALNGNKRVFDLLVSEGCDSTLVTGDREISLPLACAGGSVDLVQYIISHNNSDRSNRPIDARTSVVLAERCGHTAGV